MTTDTQVTIGAQIHDTVQAVSKAVGLTATDVETVVKNAMRYIPHVATSEDRFDVLQEIALALLSTRPTDGAFASGIARNTVGKWAERFYYRNHETLDRDTGDTESDQWYKDMLVGMTEFEARVCGDLDGAQLWDRIPGERVESEDGKSVSYTGLKGLLMKRLRGARLSGAERERLSYHRKKMTGILW